MSQHTGSIEQAQSVLSTPQRYTLSSNGGMTQSDSAYNNTLIREMKDDLCKAILGEAQQLCMLTSTHSVQPLRMLRAPVARHIVRRH